MSVIIYVFEKCISTFRWRRNEPRKMYWRLNYGGYFLECVYIICTKVLSTELWIGHNLASCLSKKYIPYKKIRRNLTAIFVWGILDLTSPTLRETVFTQHIIWCTDRIELGEKCATFQKETRNYILISLLLRIIIVIIYVFKYVDFQY